MEPGSILTALSTISTALGAAKTALEVRDFIATGAEIAKVTQELLNLQQQFLAMNTSQFQLLQEKMTLVERVRELEKERANRESYSLVEVFPGSFVYRINDRPEAAGSGEPVIAEPSHFVCQPCFDKGHKAVLQRAGSGWSCPLCKHWVRSKHDEPIRYGGPSEW